MTFLKSDRLRRALLFVAFFALALTVLALCTDAATSCGHDVGTENGFCLEVECNAYEIPTINEGDPALEGDSYYEIANAGQLYWLKNELLQKKEHATVVRAKLTAHIVVNADLLDENGAVKEEHFDEDGELQPYVYTWFFLNEIKNVELDGDGYTISGLYAVRADNGTAGLFGTAENVKIKNLGILDSIFSTGFDYVGVFFGEAIGGCVLENCFALDNVVTGLRGGALVGNLAFSGVVNTVKNCYVDAAEPFWNCAAGNEVSKCYFLANGEDNIEGTVAISSLNTETLRTALSTDDCAWVMSCLRNAPVLREEHYYKNACDADCGNFAVCKHSRAEGEEGKVEHKFDNKCDAECNICKNLRTLEKTDHYYTNVCDTDCNECGATRKAPEDHKYTNKCDEYCNYCHFKRPVAGHEFSNDCATRCNQCGYTREGAGHQFDNVCDAVCNVCATTRTVEGHKYDNACDAACNNCEGAREITHAFGEFVVVTEPTTEAEGLKEKTCSVCGYKESEKIEKLASEVEEGSSLGLYLAIGGGALAAVVAVVVIVIVLKKKRGAKSEKTEENTEE